MKNTIKWKIWLLTCIVTILPVFLGVILWDKLPESIAIHFDINNNPDNYASKGFAVLGIPLMMVILQTVCCVINDVNAKKYGERKKFELATKWIIPVMTWLLQGATLFYALGMDIDIRVFAVVIVGAVLIVIGNYLPKLDYIKQYNIDNEKVRKINRFIGFETVIMGILGIATVFMPPVASLVWIFMLIPYAIISVVYGILVGKRK